MVRRFSGYGLNPEKCPESALEVAKANIERHFSFVGLLERYDETLLALATLFGLPELRKEHVNKNKVQQDELPLSDSVLRKVREMNALDIQLYDWVKERFDRMATNLREPVLVPGEDCARPITSLWRAVGQSPIREARMKAKVFVRPNKSDPPLVFCSQAKKLVLNETAVMADVDLCFFHGGIPGDDTKVNRLVMQPAAAKKLSEQLAKAVEKYEAKFGTIRS